MSETKNSNQSTRKYPEIYEKIIPIALVIIVGAIFLLLVIIASVVLGVFPDSV
ncbi:MAG: hypothetical protein ACERKX_05980 [Anaerolineales bacterium]